MTKGIKPLIDVVSVAATATLATLLAAAGSAWRTAPHLTVLIPHAVGIYVDDGVASAADHPMGLDALELVGGEAENGELQFYAAGATSMTVIQS